MVAAMDEQISCDHAYLSRVCYVISHKSQYSVVIIMTDVLDLCLLFCYQIGRDRSRYDLEDFDLVPQKMFQTV